MKIRTDSAFAALTEKDQQELLALSKTMDAVELAELYSQQGSPCTPLQMRKLLRRLRNAQTAAAAGVSEELIDSIDDGGDGLRDVTLAAARTRMLREIAGASRADLVRIFKCLSDEKNRDKKIALDERRVLTLEDSARLGWKKLDLERAIAASRLLPRLWAIITDATLDEKQRLARAYRCLLRQSASFEPQNAIVDTISEPLHEPLEGSTNVDS